MPLWSCRKSLKNGVISVGVSTDSYIWGLRHHCFIDASRSFGISSPGYSKHSKELTVLCHKGVYTHDHCDGHQIS